MGSADKKTRKKRTRKIAKPLSSPSSGSVQTSQNSLPAFLPDLKPKKSEQEEIEELQCKMDADTDAGSQPLPAVAKSSNPYLGGSCLFCHCKRNEAAKTDADPLLEGNQLQLWVCSNCRKTVDEEDKRNATMASLLISMEQDLKLEPPSIPPLEPISSPSNSPTSSSEPTTPNGSVCNCEACTERRLIEREQEKENAELKEVWGELGHAVRYVYREAGTGMSQAGESAGMPDTGKMKEHVHRLCMRDPHHLFQQLECQGRDYVIEMKVRLLKQLTAGHKTPPQAKQFVAMLLEEYKNLCTAASTLASYLTELMDHLKRFNLTWELHNKHLFQSIIYTDPVVQNSLPMLMTQLRLGAASKEAYHEDTYPNILHRYLKFDDEMSVISVVWRDCEQLLENYNDEQTAIKAKQKMMKEDLDFFMAQRKLLEENVLKNMPVSAPAASVVSASQHLSHNSRHDTQAHSLEAQFSERMRSILQGNNRSSEEQSLCPNCNRKVCPCDECSINHTVFCGIINPEVADQMPVHSSTSGGYPHDASRYIIDVKAPSMSSISSSSGSESPITVDPERLSFPFDDNFQLDEDADEIQEDIEDKISDSPDSEEDEETSTDEFEEEEQGGGGASLHSNHHHANSQNNKRAGGDNGHLHHPGERQQGDGQENQFVPGSNVGEGNPPQESPCDCTHCAQASILQKSSLEVDSSSPPLPSAPQQCQCHACLMQTGQSLTTSLPQHLPSAPRPAALHLYPHIHGSNAIHPGVQGEQGGPTMQSVLRPRVYELHGMHHTPTGQKSFTNLHTNKSQQPSGGGGAGSAGGFNFDLNSHDLYNAFDWDSAPFDTAKLNMFGAGHKYTNNVTSELLNVPTPPLLTGNPFLKELSGVDSSLANLMKTSTVLQHCVSAAIPLTSTTVTTSTGITTSIQGISEANTAAAASLLQQSAFSDTQNKIFKVSKALLNQQQQNKPKVPTHGHHLSATTQTGCGTSATPVATSSTFTFGLPSPLNKNLSSSPLGGLFAGAHSPQQSSSSSLPSSCSTSPTSSLSSLSNSPPQSTSTPPAFSLTSPPADFCFKQSSSSPSSSPQQQQASYSPTSNQSSPQQQHTSIVSPSAGTTTTTTSHQLKLNPDFIRAAAALQKNISEQNAARQQQHHHSNVSSVGHTASSLHNYQAFSNLNLQNFTAGLPPSHHQQQQQQSLLTCTHQFSAGGGGGAITNPIMQLAGANSPALSMPTPNTTPVGLATSGLKLTNNQFLPSHTHHNNHMTLPTQPVSPAATGGGNHIPHQAGTIPPPQGSNNNINTAVTANSGQNSNSPPATAVTTCNDPDCDGHHDNDNDSIDDSCSEQSSSTSTSNQKDGKYCDCCYCEFFGHTTPPTVPISKNYPEMRERLRKRLKIKNEKKKGGPVNVNPDCPMAGKLAEKMKQEEEMLKLEEPPEPCLDPMEQKGLDELVRFINGSSLEEQKKSSKAAKRARQKQRKAEEKASKEAEIIAKHAAEEAIRKQQQQQLLLQNIKQQQKAEAKAKAANAAKTQQPISGQTESGAKKKCNDSSNKASTPTLVNNGKKVKQKAEKNAEKQPESDRNPHNSQNSTSGVMAEKHSGAKMSSKSEQHESTNKSKSSSSGNSSTNKCSKQSIPESHQKKSETNGNVESGRSKGQTGPQTPGGGGVSNKPSNVKNSSDQKGKLTNIEQKVNQLEQRVNHVMLSSQHLQKKEQQQTSQQNHKNELLSSSSATNPTTSANSHNNKTTSNPQQITLNGDINMNNTTTNKGKTQGKKGKIAGSNNSNSTPQNSPRPGSAQGEGAKPGKAAGVSQQNSTTATNPTPPNSTANNSSTTANSQAPAVSNGKTPVVSSQQARAVNLQLADSIKQAAQKVVQQGQANNNKVTANSQLPQQVVNAVLSKAAGKGIANQVFQAPPLPPGVPPPPSSGSQHVSNHHLQQQQHQAQQQQVKNPQPSPRPGVPLNRPILHAQRTLKDGARKTQQQQQQGHSNTNIPQSPIPPASQNGTCSASGTVTHTNTNSSNNPGNNSVVNSGHSLITPAVRSMISSSAPSTPDQMRHHGNGHQDIAPSAQTATQLNFQQRSVPNTPTKQPPTTTQHHGNTMAAAQGKSRSEGQLNWANKDGGGGNSAAGGRSKKKGRRNKVGEQATSVDEIFLPKEDPEHTEMDEFERELEDFKRFCLDSKPPPRKLQVNVNLKDIFAKKKSGLGCA